ncbi:MAG: hypothetical protein HYS27_01195 [Deltaproteobacteria bacterium]|nr:hypothetical protein [Deltaproteobacteria bacterium]
MSTIAPQKLNSLATLRAKDPAAFDASVATIAKGGSAGNLEAAALAKRAGVGVLDVLELATAGIELLAKHSGVQTMLKEGSTLGSAPTFGGVGAGGTLKLKGFVGREVERVQHEARNVLDALREFAPLTNASLIDKPGADLGSKVGHFMQRVGAFFADTGNAMLRESPVNADHLTADEATRLLGMIKGADAVVLAALRPRFEAHLARLAPERIDGGAKEPLAEIRKLLEGVPPEAREAAALLSSIARAGYDFESNPGPSRAAQAAVLKLEVPLPLQKEAIEVLEQSFKGQIEQRRTADAQWANDYFNPLNPMSPYSAANPANWGKPGE